MDIKAFIFDLDGVIVSTDEHHYQAWKKLAEEEGIPYSRELNILQRGVSRMESLEIMLQQSPRVYSLDEKIRLADRKNRYYQEMITTLQPADLLPGVDAFLTALQERGIAVAIGSSSKNAMPILRSIGMDKRFDAIADGTQITHSKPDPEVFLLAARLLHEDPGHCIVVEDADAGIRAARAAGMGAFAVGTACGNIQAHFNAETLATVTCDEVLTHFQNL